MDIAVWAKPYSRYKPSGVEWLGDVPEHWDVAVLRRCAKRIQTGSTPPTTEERYYEDGTVPWYGPASFNDQIVVAQPMKWLNQSAVVDGVARLFAARSTMVITIGATLGKVSSLPEAASCNQQITVIEFDARRIHAIFATYQLKRLEPALRAVAPSATLPILDQGEIANVIFGLPPIHEQHAIADFLDRETAKIDTLVAKNRTLIKRLKEKRAALISRAVTRGLPPEAAAAVGLNPNPKLKPTGVDGLGDIPSHWDVKRVKHVVLRIEQGWSPDCDNAAAALDEWGVLKAGCCNGGRFNPDEHKALPSEIDVPQDLEVKPGDVLMSRASGSEELVGSAARVPEGIRPHLLLSDKTYRLHANPKKIDPALLARLLQSPLGRAQIHRVISGASGLAKNIAQSDVKEFLLPLAPVREQRMIADFLDRETDKFDQMVSKVESAIERLQEYRITLITAAVTGKIDVRGESADNRRVLASAS